jgi:hypothetical protein
MKFDLATFKTKKLDLALRGKRFDLATLRQMKFDPKSLRQQALKLRQKLRNRSILALTLFSNECGVRLVKRDGDVVRSEARFFLPRGADALIAQPEDFGNELAALLTANNIRERQCVVCMPPSWAFTFATDVPEELTGEDLRGFLELKAEKEFPMSISDLRLAHSAFVLPGGQRRVTVAAVPVKRIGAVEQMLATISGKLLSLSLGLDYLLATPGAPPQVHFLANGRHVDVIITSGGGVAGLRTLSTGVPPPDPAFDPVGFCREVRIMLGRLPEGVRQGVAEATFGGAVDSAEQLREKTTALLSRMGLSAPSPNESPTPPVGLEAAELFLHDQSATFEFVTPEVKPWQVWLQKVDSKRRRTMLAVAVGLVLLPIVSFMVRSHMESSLEQEWKGMQGNVSDVEKIQTKIRRFRPWFDPSPQSLSALETLASAFSENGETWAKSIQIHDGQRVTCTAFAKSQAAKDEMLGRLRKKPGVSGVQTQQVRGNSPITYTFTYKWETNRAN